MKKGNKFTSKGFNEEDEGVEEYLNLLKETERLIGSGMEITEQAEWARLWANLDQLMLYPVIGDNGSHLIYTDNKTGMQYANLFLRPAYVEPRDEDYEIGGMLSDWLKDGLKQNYSLLIHPTMADYCGHAILIDPQNGHMTPVAADYSHKHRIYLIL